MARPKEKPASWSSAFDERCLREKERLGHRLATELRDDMLRLLEQGLESDLTVLTSGGQVNLHRCIVKQRCPQLLTELLDDPAEGSTVKLHSTNLESFNQIVRFIYSEDDLSPVLNDLRELIKEKQQHNHKVDLKTVTKNCQLTANSSDHLVNTSGQPEDAQTQDNDLDVLNGNVESDISLARSDLETCVQKSDRGLESRREKEVVTNGQNGEVKEKEKEAAKGKVDGACSRLAQDLLDMLHRGDDTDVVLTSAGKSVRCHRCILSARSDYFSAMLGGSWRESSATQIALEGLSETALDDVVEFVYGRLDSESSMQCPVVEMAMISDMYTLHGLKLVVSFLIKRDKCHFFHKPCSGCLLGTLDIVPLVFTYQLNDIWERALKWITKHFVRTWPLKQFSGLPEEIREKCLEAAIADITSDSVLEMIIDCDCLMGSLSNVRWSEPVVVMATGLMDACIQHLRVNLTAVVGTVKFNSLGSTMALGLSLLEDVFSRAILTMPREKICQSYHAVHQLKVHSESEHCIWNGDFRKLVETLNAKCEHYVRLHINYVVHTDEWKTVMTADMQDKIKEGVWYVCVGDAGPVRAPPKLTSTQKDGCSKRGTRPGLGARPKTSGPASTAARKTTQQEAKAGRGVNSAGVTMRDKKPQQSRSYNTADKTRTLKDKSSTKKGRVTKSSGKAVAEPQKLKTTDLHLPKLKPKSATMQPTSNRPPGKLDTQSKASAIPVMSPRQSNNPVSFLANFTGPLPFNFQCVERDHDMGSAVSLVSNRATVNSNLSTPSSETPGGSGSYYGSLGSDVFSSNSLSPEDTVSAATLPLIPVTDLTIRCHGLIFIEDGFLPILTWHVTVF